MHAPVSQQRRRRINIVITSWNPPRYVSPAGLDWNHANPMSPKYAVFSVILHGVSEM